MKLVIIGKGGHGKVVADIAEALGYEIVGRYDSDDYPRDKSYEYFIAIGNAANREKVANELVKENLLIATLIHPTAVISKTATIGIGTVVMPYAVVNAEAKVGKYCILNTSSVVEHKCTIGDFSHISVNAAIGGQCQIGKNTWIGIGSSVSNNINICDDVYLGAGAVVCKDIAEAGTHVGCPARRIK